MLGLTPIKHKGATATRGEDGDVGGTKNQSKRKKKARADRDHGGDQGDEGDDGVVATNEALKLAAGWLGVSAEDVMGGLDADGGGGGSANTNEQGGVGLFAGLGFGTKKKQSFKSNSRENSAWNRKVDERLLKRKSRPREEAKQGREREEEGEGEEEEESRAAAVGGRNKPGGFSKMDMLKSEGGSTKLKKKKKKR